MGIGCELPQKGSSACLPVKCHEPLPGELGGRQGWSLGNTLDFLPTARLLAPGWLGKGTVPVWESLGPDCSRKVGKKQLSCRSHWKAVSKHWPPQCTRRCTRALPGDLVVNISEESQGDKEAALICHI